MGFESRFCTCPDCGTFHMKAGVSTDDVTNYSEVVSCCANPSDGYHCAGAYHKYHDDDGNDLHPKGGL